MWMIALNFLKSNWEWVALGVCAVFILGYITFLKMSLDHYKTKAETVTAEFNAYKAKAKAELEIFEAKAAATSKAANDALAAKNKVIFEQMEELNERIRKDEELARTTVSSRAVRMLNESASRRSAAADTDRTSKDAVAGERSPNTVEEVSLTVVFETMVENNSNHNQCINQVLELQNWYNKLRNSTLHENPS